MDNNKYRAVNRGLDIQPLILFIPADMFLPWSAILIVTYLAKELFQLNWFIAIFLAGWGMATWWFLTYKGTWTFLSKFISPRKWTRGHGTYKSVVDRGIKMKSEVRSQKSEVRN